MITIKLEEEKCPATGTGLSMLVTMAWRNSPIGTILLNCNGGDWRYGSRTFLNNHACDNLSSIIG